MGIADSLLSIAGCRLTTAWREPGSQRFYR